jgi:hypothetical protein
MAQHMINVTPFLLANPATWRIICALPAIYLTKEGLCTLFGEG